MIKLIAIGNRLMCDEGIAVKIAEDLKDELVNENIEVYFKETAADFSTEEFVDSDLFFVLDATCYSLEPGTITLMPIEKYNSHFNSYITKHDFSPLNSLCKGKNRSGYVIGIEIDKITFDDNLSEKLDNKFDLISDKVRNLIKVLKYSPNTMDISIIQNQINCLN